MKNSNMKQEQITILYPALDSPHIFTLKLGARVRFYGLVQVFDQILAIDFLLWLSL